MVVSIGIPMTRIIGASGLDSRMYSAYILQSEKDGSYYIGCTKDFRARLIRHNKGYSRYTKAKRIL